MTGQELTLDDLTTALQQSAGQANTDNLDGSVLDVTFEDLGYDSVALLETCGRIEREQGIQLDDCTVEDAKTPRALLILINEQLAEDTAA
jgi:act minimal PKS acyl carrier protein